MNPLDTLTQAVNDETGAADSIIALVGGLSTYIKDHASDPAAMLALADSLNAKKQAILDAVAANPVPGQVLMTGAKKK